MRRLRLRPAVALGAAVLLFTLVAGTWLLLDRTWHTANDAAERSLERTAETVESAVNRHILQTDGALISLPSLLAGLAPPGGATDAATASRVLGSLNFQTFAFRDLLLVQPDGTLWASARPHPRGLRLLPGGRAGGRSGAAPFAGAVSFEGPLRNPLTGDWDLLVVRSIPLAGHDGLVAVAEVPLPFLTALLAEAGRTPGMRISLNRQDGTLLAALPLDEGQFGRPQPLLVGQPHKDGVAFAAPPTMLPVPAIVVIRHTLYPDILIAASISRRAAMRDWTRDRNRLLGGLAIVASLVLGLAIVLCEVLRQHARLEHERSLARSVLDGAIEAMSVGFVIWGADDRLVSCNQRYRDMYPVSAPFIATGATFEEIVRQGAAHGQYPQAGDDIEAFVADLVAWHRSDSGTVERLLPDGRWLLATERSTIDGGIVGIRIDVTSLRQALGDLEAANARAQAAVAEVQQQNAALASRDAALDTQNRLFQAALNNMSHGLLMTDASQRMIVCNRRFLELFGLAADVLPTGVSARRMFHAIIEAGVFDHAMLERVRVEQDGLARGRRAGTFVANDPDGRALSVAQRPMDDGGWVAIYEDVTEQHHAEGRIRFMAHHDALTGLPNRVLLRIRMEEMLRSRTDPASGVALLYLDLDKFKDVNDALGHAAGDALLAAAGARLLGCLRDGDVVARLGGDEFAVLSAAIDIADVVGRLGERIIEALSAPYELDGHCAIVGASVGIAVAAPFDSDPDTLLKKADMALYEAKASGRGVCSVFRPELEQRLHARLQTEADLRSALEQRELMVYYQPILGLHGDRISGFEALVRWHHPARGFIPPGEFIPLAEDSGLINAVGTWVLQRACQDIAALPARIKIAVNLSPVQLRGDDIIQVVTGALARSGLHPSRLELEITESALLQGNERTVALLHRLHAIGVRVVLDDFGTGYSSLSHLRSFPFDKLKIDQSFVREMGFRPDCAAIVQSAVSLADKLGMMTTAEGVETADQLVLVRNAGCSEAQGYLLGAPAPIDTMLASLRRSAYFSEEDEMLKAS